MGVRILVGKEQGDDQEKAVLFDSVTETAFGPLFQSEGEAAAFLSWLEIKDGRNARIIMDDKLHELLYEYRQGTDNGKTNETD